MFSRIVYILFILSLLIGVSSCRSKRGPKEYIEKNGLHSDKKPHELAEEFRAKGKKVKKAYRKQQRRIAKDIKKRNKKKVKGGYYENK